MSRIVIVGAGYAGLLAANRAAARHQVVLVNDADHFLDRIRLHEVIAGTRTLQDARRPLRASLDARAGLVVARAVRVAPGRVTLDNGRVVDADHVVVAVGSGDGPGGADWAVRNRDAVARLRVGAHVTVIGAGFTGLETASELAEARPELEVTLVDRGDPFARYPDVGRRSLREALDRLSIAVAANPPAHADLTIDCTGFRYPSLARDSDLPVDEAGRLLLNEQLRVPGVPTVWGAGDAVHVDRLPHLRDSCAAALPMGAFVVDQMDRLDRGQALRPLSLGYAVWCLSLGRGTGLITSVTRDDRPGGTVIGGRPGALVKETVCRAAVAAPIRLARWWTSLPGPLPTADATPTERRERSATVDDAAAR